MYCLIEMICTALVEIFGAIDGSCDLCHSCYYWTNISRQILTLFFSWSDTKSIFQKKWKQKVKSGIWWRSGVSLCQSPPLSHTTWLTDDLSSFQGSCFLQANNGSATKMPQVLVHSRGWKFRGAVRCEQRNHGGRTGSKCGCSAGATELWIRELLSFSKLC